jgi:hypothetical protein
MDWNKFAERVPAGTRVKMDASTVDIPSELLVDDIEGILWHFQENDPEDDSEDPYLYPEDAGFLDGVIWIFPFVFLDDFWLDPKCSEYLLDNKWQTFNEIMGDSE